MRALLVRDFGPPRSHAVEDVPAPDRGDEDVLIDVHAAGLNFADLLMLQGLYQTRPERPFVPGRDAAGVVAEAGAKVTRCKVGDRVIAQVATGAFAEQLAAHQSRVFRIPDEMGFQTAAAMVTPYNTAYIGVVVRGQVVAGETVLIAGASGGLGLACLQLCKARDARVIAGVTSESKAEFVRKHGADATIDLGVDNLREALREQVYAVNDGKGVDVILDPVGGDVFDAAMRALAFAGRMVILGFASGRIPEAKANYLLLKNLAVMGAPIDIHFKERPDIVEACVAQLMELFVEGKIRPDVTEVIRIENFHEAVDRFEKHQVMGKIALTMGG